MTGRWWRSLARTLFRCVERLRPGWRLALRRDLRRTVRGVEAGSAYRVDSVAATAQAPPEESALRVDPLAMPPGEAARILAQRLRGRAEVVAIVVSGYRSRESRHVVSIKPGVQNGK